jgi:2-dehydro-3-deoxyphosphogluconate aldolase/(4S)-4-hydroxy-2-oxoglutarate aldolase
MTIPTVTPVKPQTPEVITRLCKARLVPVIRANTAADALWGAEQLIAAGLDVVEIGWTVPDAGDVVESLVKRFPHVQVGAGTILSWEQYQQALLAGAHWFVSPMLNETLACDILANGGAYIPAVATPTELYRACLLGVPVIKWFPAKAMGGVAGLKTLMGPFNNARLLPTGGIGLEEIPDYLEAGAVAVGLGNSLVSPELLASRDTDTVTQRAAEAQFFRDKAVLHSAAGQG